MIKVGIIGGETRNAGEIIRTLLIHPDIDIKLIYSSKYTGRNVSSIHHGLIGESELVFSDQFNPETIDVVIITNTNISNKLQSMIDQSDLKVIDMRGLNGNLIPANYHYGLSEINRKSIVREAKKVIVASPAVVPVLISLYPLARNLMLTSGITIELMIPDEMRDEKNISNIKKEIEDRLKEVQYSYSGDIHIITSNNRDARVMEARISLPINADLTEVEKIYNSVYSDHNFSYIIKNKDIKPEEVAGTHKCIIAIQKPSEFELKLKVISDFRMRGGAGEAVHLMNLLFGLAEKTGLNLKASNY